MLWRDSSRFIAQTRPWIACHLTIELLFTRGTHMGVVLHVTGNPEPKTRSLICFVVTGDALWIFYQHFYDLFLWHFVIMTSCQSGNDFFPPHNFTAMMLQNVVLFILPFWYWASFLPSKFWCKNIKTSQVLGGLPWCSIHTSRSSTIPVSYVFKSQWSSVRGEKSPLVTHSNTPHSTPHHGHCKTNQSIYDLKHVLNKKFYKFKLLHCVPKHLCMEERYKMEIECDNCHCITCNIHTYMHVCIRMCVYICGSVRADACTKTYATYTWHIYDFVYTLCTCTWIASMIISSYSAYWQTFGGVHCGIF